MRTHKTTEGPGIDDLAFAIEGVHPRLLSLLLTEAGIPGKVRGLRLGEVEPTRYEETGLEAGKNFVDHLRDHYVSPHRPMDQYPKTRSKIGQGLLFVGPPGTGKTTLAALVVQEIFIRYRLPVLFTGYADLISGQVEMIRLEKSGHDPDRLAELHLYMRKCYEVPVLCLDDVGNERRTGSGFAEDEFTRILRTRHREMHPTIVTSNLEGPDWAEVYGPAMASFLKESFKKVAIGGGDIR